MSGDVTPLTTLLPVSEMNNTTTYVNKSMNEEEFSDQSYHVVVPTIWAFIIVIGAIGNSIVVFTMCKQGGRSMPRSATNCYIINVALADLAFLLLVVPFTAANFVSPEWIFGITMCKINNYVIYVSLLSTCLTLTAMTIDRYFAIVHPIRSLRTRTPKVAFLICLSIWIASMMVCSPYLKFYELGVHKNVTVCKMEVPKEVEKALTVIFVMVTYVIPLAVIIISYALILHNLWGHKIGGHSRHDNRHNGESSEPALGTGDTIANRRRRVAKMVATVVVLFAISWLPIHVLVLYFSFHDNVQWSKSLYDFKIFAHTLSYTNSCVNPFVYSIMGDGFRKAFKESLQACIGSSKKPQRYGTSYCPRRVTTTAETGLNGD